MTGYKILLLAGLMLVGGNMAYAQDEKSKKEERKALRAEKKKEKAEKRAENFARYIDLVESQQFVIEANTIQDRAWNTYQVNSNINFVAIEGDDVTIQLGFNELVGTNGVGGFTTQGKLISYDINKTDNAINVLANVSTPLLGPSTIRIQVDRNGNAKAYMTGTFGLRLTYSGDFTSPGESNIYKGRPII
ncbi:MAG: DUF4251 domain-containing protein [Bacteroidota bacterium]